MSYHIKQIINHSVKSAAIVNLHSSPDGRDSQIILPDTNKGIKDPILIQQIQLSGIIPYDSAADNQILNVYTVKDNWFVWDNGKSALIGVAEGTPSQNDSFYKGAGTDLTLTIDADGGITFTKYVTASV